MRDLDHHAADAAEQLTDTMAELAIAAERDQAFRGERVGGLYDRIARMVCGSTRLTLSTPEGFAYYGLHPLDYADAVATCVHDSAVACVIGLRSIGSTLSAIVLARLRAERVAAQRFTVRPDGHPYDRHCAFNSDQRQQIRAALAANAAFFICDEGPGRSGSSFLSVAEALEREGVSPHRITLLCAYQPDLIALCAPRAAQRWSRYTTVACGMTKRLPGDAGEYVGGGTWRARFVEPEDAWPASWTQMERLKYISRDCTQLLKFSGHGHYGEHVAVQEKTLAEAGFGPPYAGSTLGFSRHALVPGRPGDRSRVSRELLEQMAAYCAWRPRGCSVTSHTVADLENATRLNIEAEYGAAPELALHVERPVIADGRMQPHEWIRCTDGRWLKCDAATHGDDHFFPGPCDIAWDVAGVIVEWELAASAVEAFISHYECLSGDHISARLPAYMLAYASFRMAWCGMAAQSMAGTEDEVRLLESYRTYRAVASQSLHRRAKASIVFLSELEGRAVRT